MPVLPPDVFDVPGIVLGEFPEIPDLGKLARFGAVAVLGQGLVLMGHGDWGPMGLISILPTKERLALGGGSRTPDQIEKETLPGPGILLMFTTTESVAYMRTLLDKVEELIKPWQVPIFEVQYPEADRVVYVAAAGPLQAFYFAQGDLTLAPTAGDQGFASTSIRVLQITPRRAAEIEIGSTTVWAEYLRLRGTKGPLAECDKGGRRSLVKEQP